MLPSEKLPVSLSRSPMPKPNFNVDDGPKVFHFFASFYRLPVCCFLIEVFALVVCHLDANLNANSLFVVAKILC